jgi:hypothetical protein
VITWLARMKMRGHSEGLMAGGRPEMPVSLHIWQNCRWLMLFACAVGTWARVTIGRFRPFGIPNLHTRSSRASTHLRRVGHALQAVPAENDHQRWPQPCKAAPPMSSENGRAVRPPC